MLQPLEVYLLVAYKKRVIKSKASNGSIQFVIENLKVTDSESILDSYGKSSDETVKTMSRTAKNQLRILHDESIYHWSPLMRELSEVQKMTNKLRFYIHHLGWDLGYIVFQNSNGLEVYRHHDLVYTNSKGLTTQRDEKLRIKSFFFDKRYPNYGRSAIVHNRHLMYINNNDQLTIYPLRQFETCKISDWTHSNSPERIIIPGYELEDFDIGKKFIYLLDKDRKIAKVKLFRRRGIYSIGKVQKELRFSEEKAISTILKVSKDNDYFVVSYCVMGSIHITTVRFLLYSTRGLTLYSSYDLQSDLLSPTHSAFFTKRGPVDVLICGMTVRFIQVFVISSTNKLHLVVKDKEYHNGSMSQMLVQKTCIYVSGTTFVKSLSLKV